MRPPTRLIPVKATPRALSAAASLALLAFVAALAPAAELFVDPSGADSNPGTRDRPLRTISRAAQQAAAGDVVTVRAGVYRERVAPRRGGEPGRPIVYRAAPGERVFIKGSEVWKPEWRRHGGGVYSASPDPALFNDRSGEYLDNHNPFKVELSSTPWGREGRREHERREAGEDRIHETDERVVYTCGQVFVDGGPLTEVPLREELRPGSWFYDARGDRVYVHFGEETPEDQFVEITTRRRLFAPKRRGLGHITVEGFVFEHCGNQYPTNFWKTDAYAQKGAVGSEAGDHWVIRNNVVRYAKTFAIDVGNVDRHSRSRAPRGTIVENNYVIDNGSAGVLSSGSRGLVIRGNVILRNNRLRFLGVKRWEQAGVKCHHFRDGLIEGNYIADNYDTYGVWLDNQFPDCRVTRNVIHGNGRAGVFLEMSDYEYDRLLIDNNLVFDNQENAVYIHDASGATFMHNLFANTRDTLGYGQAVFLRQSTTRTRSYHHSFYNNLLLGNARNVDVNYPAARSGPQRFDGNLYGVAPAARGFVINRKSDKPSPWTVDEFTSLVHADFEAIGRSERPEVDEGEARMTLGDWRAFWRRHGVANDTRSLASPGGEVAYDRASHRLTIRLDVDPGAVGSVDRAPVDEDFLGAPLPHGGRSRPGPFQGLKAGENEFQIWDGLPIVADGELPPVGWRG